MAGGTSQASALEQGQSYAGVWGDGACGGMGVSSASGTMGT